MVKTRLQMAGFLLLNERGEILLLFRNKWGHWETPGGKADPNEIADPANPTEIELKQIALRELHEELAGDYQLSEIKYFGFQDFIIPDGRLGRAHKFTARYFSGEIEIGEPEVFSKFEWIPIQAFSQKILSPDLKLMLPKIVEKLSG